MPVSRVAAKGKEKPLQKSITGVKGLTERPAAPQADGGLKNKASWADARAVLPWEQGGKDAAQI